MKELILSYRDFNTLAVVEQDKYLTYKELHNTSSSIADDLNSLLNCRSHIAILLPNSISYVVAYVAIVLAEHVIVPIYYKAATAEILSTLNYCDISMVITDSVGVEKILNETIDHKVYAYNIDTHEVFTIGNLDKEPSINSPADTFIMLGTSGSTSNPKRVMLSNENIIANANDIIGSLNYNSSERILSVLPLTFASGNTSQLCVSLVLGATLYIYSDPFYPEHIYKAITKYGITATTLVPSLLKILLSDNTFINKDAPSLKKVCFGGNSTDYTTYKRLLESTLSDKFVHLYGQTEASPRISHLHLCKDKGKLPSVGQALNGVEVSVAKLHPEDKEGEIYIRGKNVMLGYYKCNASPINDGWLATGDIGYIDDDGYIYITGRKKNIIIYSGMNIYPEEVEEVICQNEDVSEAIVVGEQSEQYGEIPVAKVVLKKSGSITESELRKFCARKLSKYKVPVRIHFVDSLQYTQNGKILRSKEASHE